MKMRNKGKVYPSSSSSTPSPFPVTGDSLSVLNLLPAAILSLAVVLSVEDREVLAYMITRSIKSTNPSSSSSSGDNKKKAPNTHKSPVFDCDCFDCYTSYWFKWDTSPNRELIHQVIEAFEENLNSSEQSKKKGKKKEKTGNRRLTGKTFVPLEEAQCVETPPQYDVALAEAKSEVTNAAAEEGVVVNGPEEEQPPGGATTSHYQHHQQQQHKGLTRKVLPDVIGLFNWRLWSVWSPNV